MLLMRIQVRSQFPGVTGHTFGAKVGLCTVAGALFKSVWTGTIRVRRRAWLARRGSRWGANQDPLTDTANDQASPTTDV